MNEIYRGLFVLIPTTFAVAIMLWILWNFYKAGRGR
jgi:hypothetical protein